MAQAATLAGVIVAFIRHRGWGRMHQESEWVVAGLEAGGARYPTPPARPAHPSQDVAEVQESILATCRSVAEESKEGGILDFGGTEVDPFEDGVIQEIARTLRA